MPWESNKPIIPWWSATKFRDGFDVFSLKVLERCAISKRCVPRLCKNCKPLPNRKSWSEVIAPHSTHPTLDESVLITRVISLWPSSWKVNEHEEHLMKWVVHIPSQGFLLRSGWFKRIWSRIYALYKIYHVVFPTSFTCKTHGHGFNPWFHEAFETQPPTPPRVTYPHARKLGLIRRAF